jgi:hypothetical protein
MPRRQRQPWADIHIYTRLHRSAASRGVPIVCIQKAHHIGARSSEAGHIERPGR